MFNDIIPDLPREVVNAFVTITLGHGKPPARWPDEAKEEGINVADYPLKVVKPLILARHPVLGDLDGLDWARLQWLESKAIIATMLTPGP